MMRSVYMVLAGAIVAFWVTGCATEQLGAAGPGGVHLTGEWQFNPDLSDDPDKLAPDPDEPRQLQPGGHRGHGGERGGGMPPMGSPGSGGYNYLPTALSAAGLEQATPLPPASTPSDSGSKPSKGASINRLLQAPTRLSITQKDAAFVIKSTMPDGTQTADEYTAGTKTTIPHGKEDTAERSVGWRGPVFVIATTVKKGGWREDDFAIDADGRLIMTTRTKGGRLGKLEITRVYDRLRGTQS